ncbi:MAG: hypothetical protein A2V67_18285 [Deltaproteobacteria bacterium RBG_13_61_14]|nr:MAG: hypothetical protein A2V67_18285 [Deltaproteobacteria bacterium RBG_13_61_14]
MARRRLKEETMGFRQIFIALDGPVLDRSAGYFALFRELMQEFEFPCPPWPQFALSFQKGLSLRALLPARWPAAVEEKLMEQWEERLEELEAGGGDRVWPEVPSVLSTWSRHAFLVLVARRRALHQVLGQVDALGLRPFFRVIVLSSQWHWPDARLWSSPAPESKNSLLVAGHPWELQSGKARGLITAAVTAGPFPLSQILAAKPDYVWSRLREGNPVVREPGRREAELPPTPRAFAVAGGR